MDFLFRLFSYRSSPIKKVTLWWSSVLPIVDRLTSKKRLITIVVQWIKYQISYEDNLKRKLIFFAVLLKLNFGVPGRSTTMGDHHSKHTRSTNVLLLWGFGGVNLKWCGKSVRQKHTCKHDLLQLVYWGISRGCNARYLNTTQIYLKGNHCSTTHFHVTCSKNFL